MINTWQSISLTDTVTNLNVWSSLRLDGASSLGNKSFLNKTMKLPHLQKKNILKLKLVNLKLFHSYNQQQINFISKKKKNNVSIRHKEHLQSRTNANLF